MMTVMMNRMGVDCCCVAVDRKSSDTLLPLVMGAGPGRTWIGVRFEQ